MGTCITAQNFTCGKLRMIQPFGKAEKFSKNCSMIPDYHFYNTIRNINTQLEFAKQNIKKMNLSRKKLQKHNFQKLTQLSSISHNFQDRSTCFYWQYCHVLKITLLNLYRKFKTDFQDKEKRFKTYCSSFTV